MTLTFAGVVDVVTDGQAGRYIQMNEAFMACHNLLVSSYGQSLGISRIACNFGLNGVAMDYWDSTTPGGDNIWACFKFASASSPFYLLLHASGNEDADTSPGSPTQMAGPLNSGFNNTGIGFAIGIRSDGGNPWNGTTRNDGTDTKGSVVWTSGSSANTLMVFPRPNSDAFNVGETRSTAKTLLQIVKAPQANGDLGFQSAGSTGVPQDNGNKNSKFHFIVAKDHFFAACDIVSLGIHNIAYFGKFTTSPGLTHPFPYCMIGLDHDTVGNGYGNFGFWQMRQVGAPDVIVELNSGFPPTVYAQGGIVDPLLKKVVTMHFDISDMRSDGGDDFGSSAPPFSRSTLTGNYELSNIIIGSSATTVTNTSTDVNAGWYTSASPPMILGEIDFMKAVAGLSAGSTIGGGKYYCYGATIPSTMKFAVPWPANYNTGTRTNRYGYSFLVTQ